MGRAKNKQQAGHNALARFDSVFGASRGTRRHQKPLLDSGREGSDELHNWQLLLQRDEIGGALVELYDYRQHLQEPLVQELLAATSASLVRTSSRLWHVAADDFFCQTVHDGNSDYIVIDSSSNDTLHLWPAGSRIAFPKDSLQFGDLTSCGMAVDADFERMPRGSWNSKNYIQCPSCARAQAWVRRRAGAAHSDLQQEISEHRDHGVFPGEKQAAFELLLQQQIKEGLSEALKGKQVVEESKAHSLASRAYRKELLTTTVAFFRDQDSCYLQRVLGEGEWQRLLDARQSQASEPLPSDLQSQVVHDLLKEALPRQPKAASALVGSNAAWHAYYRKQERMRRRLANRLAHP